MNNNVDDILVCFDFFLLNWIKSECLKPLDKSLEQGRNRSWYAYLLISFSETLKSSRILASDTHTVFMDIYCSLLSIFRIVKFCIDYYSMFMILSIRIIRTTIAELKPTEELVFSGTNEILWILASETHPPSDRSASWFVLTHQG